MIARFSPFAYLYFLAVCARVRSLGAHSLSWRSPGAGPVSGTDTCGHGHHPRWTSWERVRSGARDDAGATNDLTQALDLANFDPECLMMRATLSITKSPIRLHESCTSGNADQAFSQEVHVVHSIGVPSLQTASICPVHFRFDQVH